MDNIRGTPHPFKRRATDFLQDVLLSKAKEGVKVQIIVWAHRILSVINRLLYLGEISIDREVAKLKTRAEKLGLKVEVFHEYSGKPVRSFQRERLTADSLPILIPITY